MVGAIYVFRITKWDTKLDRNGKIVYVCLVRYDERLINKGLKGIGEVAEWSKAAVSKAVDG